MVELPSLHVIKRKKLLNWQGEKSVLFPSIKAIDNYREKHIKIQREMGKF
jgi:hypothetical protein